LWKNKRRRPAVKVTPNENLAKTAATRKKGLGDCEVNLLEEKRGTMRCCKRQSKRKVRRSGAAYNSGLPSNTTARGMEEGGACWVRAHLQITPRRRLLGGSRLTGGAGNHNLIVKVGIGHDEKKRSVKDCDYALLSKKLIEEPEKAEEEIGEMLEEELSMRNVGKEEVSRVGGYWY